jgi:hypothetical protein
MVLLINKFYIVVLRYLFIFIQIFIFIQTKPFEMKRSFLPLGNVLAVVYLLILFSCTKELSTKKIAISVASPKDTNFVSFALASAVATRVSNSHLVNSIMSKEKIRAKATFSTRQILDSLAIPNNINPSYYILNYAGGGFAIISADKRVEPILAYSDDGYFPRSGKLPAGLINWLMLNHKNMQRLRKDTTLKVPRGIAYLWAELNTTNPAFTRSKIDVTQPPPPPCQPTYYIQSAGPLLQTSWGQGWPYNALCPAGEYSNHHMPTGCVATAMAQVMYYWKYPATYNWSLMPLDYSDNGTYELGRLMADAGTSVNMIYAVDGSSPSGANISCSTAFMDYFNYRYSSEGNYNYAQVLNNLNSNEPVILDASTDNHTFLFWNWYYEGHTWVCDGYQEVTSTFCPSGGQTTLSLHMNWGWNESFDQPYSSNGWYDYGQWIVTNQDATYNYQYNQAMTYNIHP